MPPTTSRRSSDTAAAVKPKPKASLAAKKSAQGIRPTNHDMPRMAATTKNGSSSTAAATGAGVVKKRKRRQSVATKAAKLEAATKARRDLNKADSDGGAKKKTPQHPKPTITFNDELKSTGMEYEVEKVVNSRVSGNYRFYQVKWVGYPASANTWEPEVHLRNSTDLIAEFDRAHPDKP